MSTGPVSGPWQRFVTLSVRGLVVLVLVVGAGLGWLGQGAPLTVRPSRRSRTLAASSIMIGSSTTGGSSFREENPWRRGDSWISWGSTTWPRNVGLAQGDNTDDDETRWASTRLQELRFFGKSRYHADLAHLTGLTELTELEFGLTPVTDAGLASLEQDDQTQETRPPGSEGHGRRAATSEGDDQTL